MEQLQAGPTVRAFAFYHSKYLPKKYNAIQLHLVIDSDAFGITLVQFFAEDMNAVPLTPEQKRLFDKWANLTPAQKDLIEKLTDELK